MLVSALPNGSRSVGDDVTVDGGVYSDNIEAMKDCDQKNRLAQEYESATTQFSEAVKELRRQMGTSLKEEYARLDRAANEARVKSEHARLALEEHIAAHGC